MAGSQSLVEDVVPGSLVQAQDGSADFGLRPYSVSYTRLSEHPPEHRLRRNLRIRMKVEGKEWLQEELGSMSLLVL